MVSVATIPQHPALTATPSLKPSSKMLPSSSPVSILKTSKSAGVKRKMADVERSLSPVSSVSDTFDDAAPPSKKRARVTFNEKIQTHSWNQNDPATQTGMSVAMVREEIRRAIHRHVSSGESESYDQIKEIFTADPKKAGDTLYSYDLPTHTVLKNHLLGLLSHIASLDRGCSSLVHAVLESEWLGRDEPYVKLFIRFLGNLAAAQGSYLGVIFKMLVSKLPGVARGTGSLPGYPVVPVSEIYARVHMALRHIVRLIPAGSGTLSPVLSHTFPYEADSPKSYIAYTRNLIQIISYAPELQSDILALITEKLVKIDVQIQVDLEDFEDELGENLLHGVSNDPDGELDDDDDDASVLSEDEADEDRRVAEIKDNIHKVDGMIDILFEFYNSSFTTGTLADQRNSLDLIISHFQTIILPTYKSRHSQFLLFHFSQLHPDLLSKMTSCFSDLIFGKVQSGIIRQSAAAYLASFIARGAHIPSSLVRKTFNEMSAQLVDMHDKYDATCRGPDLRRYGSFYATAQAVLYIFCFRWRDLTTASIEGDSPQQVDELEPSQIAFPPNVKETLSKVIYSRLNPLKICSPGIVNEFARIAHHFQLLYVYPLIEKNKRLRISAFRNIASSGLVQMEREIRAGDHLGYQLDAYFPFDPYQLPRSRRWLEGDYVEWRGIPGLDQDDEDSDSGGEDGDEDDEDGTATDEE